MTSGRRRQPASGGVRRTPRAHRGCRLSAKTGIAGSLSIQRSPANIYSPRSFALSDSCFAKARFVESIIVSKNCSRFCVCQSNERTRLTFSPLMAGSTYLMIISSERFLCSSRAQFLSNNNKQPSPAPDFRAVGSRQSHHRVCRPSPRRARPTLRAIHWQVNRARVPTDS